MFHAYTSFNSHSQNGLIHTYKTLIWIYPYVCHRRSLSCGRTSRDIWLVRQIRLSIIDYVSRFVLLYVTDVYSPVARHRHMAAVTHSSCSHELRPIPSSVVLA